MHQQQGPDRMSNGSNGGLVVVVPDVRLVENDQFPAYSVVMDWQLLANGELDDTQALATAVAVALGTNSLASVDDRLPDPDSTDREGWWGDYDGDVIWNAWPIGTKVWLERRSAIEVADSRFGSTQTRLMNYVRDAIQPFVDRKICSRFEIVSVRVTTQRIDMLIRIYRGPNYAIDLMYQLLWQGIVS
jgi:phage gp46-like protein